MPEGFNRCVRSGGRVRTVSSGNTYTHYCFKGGKSFRGEQHTKLKKNGRLSTTSNSVPRQNHQSSVSMWKGKKR